MDEKKNPNRKRNLFSHLLPHPFTCHGLLICPTMPRATTRRTSTFLFVSGFLVLYRERVERRERERVEREREERKK